MSPKNRPLARLILLSLKFAHFAQNLFIIAFLPCFPLIYVPLALIVSFIMPLSYKNFPQKNSEKIINFAGIN